MSFEVAYIRSIRSHFLAYKALGENAMAQLDVSDLFYEPAPGSNSIAIIVRHLHGNMKSRFTNFITEDGEKPWRQREEEFQSPAGYYPAGDWEAGWECLFQAIDSLEPSQLIHTVTIRQEPHLVLDALNRQLAHYASHVGQIVYIAKMIKGEKWTSVSIPKGGSDQFNKEMNQKFKPH
jgi:hypothetical protein